MAKDIAVKDEENYSEESKHCYSKWCRNGVKFWCRKYFWEGQLRNDSRNEDGEDIINSKSTGPFSNLSHTQRKVVSMVVPAIVFHVGWWAIMITKSLWHFFPDKYFMSITMIFGSMIAGMTSEGGGAIAFPVMTLAFHVNPSIARDFSFMIQSCGMTAAAFTIIYMRIHLEMQALVWCSVGGCIGLVFGLHVIDPSLTPPQKKMGFVSIWFSFAFALFLLNRQHKRRTFHNIQNVRWWKIFVLILVGCAGGMFSSFAGSGIDICSFSILTLLFRVSEKVATPTSVVLMAVNTVVGFFWRGLVVAEISRDAWEFMMVCIPIVVIGAPLGSVLGTHFHRLVLASFVYVIDTVALVSAFAIVPQTPALAGGSVAIIVGGFIFFFIITLIGQKMLANYEKEHNLPTSDPTQDKDTKIDNGHTKGVYVVQDSKQTNGGIVNGGFQPPE